MILQLFGALALTILTTFNTIYHSFNEVNSFDKTIQQNGESVMDLVKSPYKKQITFTDEYKNSDTKLVFIAKNYEQNGKGVFYTGDTINRTTSARFNGNYSWAGVTAIFDLTYGTTIYQGSQLAFTINSYEEEDTQQRIFYLSNNYLWTSGNSKSIYNASASGGSFSVGYSIFTGSNFREYNDNFIECVNRFYNVYTIGESVFTFESAFNFNAPYGYAIESPFISDDYFTSLNPGAIKQVSIDLPFFVSNGYIYNQIKLTYFNAYGTRYKYGSDYVICETEGIGYYSYMQYINTISNASISVNLRVFGTYVDSSDNIQTFLEHTTQWKNNEYLKLYFIRDLEPFESNKISILNTTTGTGYNNTNSTDIGLGNVFTLIASAFGAIGGFLSIQIFPGLSLGLLLFAPLVVGIIIAVVWIVKR